MKSLNPMLETQKTVISDVVQKLNRYAKIHFGVTLVYCAVNELTLLNGEPWVHHLSEDRKNLRLGDDVYIPLFVENQLFAAIKACSSSAPLSEETEIEISDVVSSTLKPALQLFHSLIQFDLIQRNSRVNEPHKVVFLDEVRRHHQSDSNVTRPTKNYRGHTASKERLHVIPAKDAIQAIDNALDIHEKSRRFAFIEFSQLKESIRYNPVQIASLGYINLFVPDIMKLKKQELSAISQFLRATDSTDVPQILAGLQNPHFSKNKK